MAPQGIQRLQPAGIDRLRPMPAELAGLVRTTGSGCLECGFSLSCLDALPRPGAAGGFRPGMLADPDGSVQRPLFHLESP